MILEKLFKYEPAIIGLDIRDDFIEAVCLKRTKNGYGVDKFCSIAIPENTLENGVILNHDKLVDTLKELWRRNKIKSRHISVALRSEDLLLKIELFSNLKKDVLLDIIETKIKQYKAFSDSNPIISTIKVGEEQVGAEKKQKILIAAARKKSIDPLIKVLQQANLIVLSISLPFFAAINAIEDNSLKSKENEYKFFIEISEKQSFLAIFKGGIIQSLYSINFGTKDYISSTKTQEHLIDHINKVITLNNLDNEIDKIIVHYCDSNMDQFIENIAKKIKITIEKGFGTISSEEIEKYQVNMVSIGLAKYQTLQIDLLPREVKVASEWYKYFYYLLYSLIFAFIVMIIIFISINIYKYLLDKQLNYVKGRLDSLAIDYIQAKELKTKTSEANELLKGRKEILKELGYFYWDDILKELTKLIPDNVRLTLIDNRANKVVYLEGEAKSPTDIFAFINNLKIASYFNNIRLDEVKHEKDRDIFIFKVYAEENIKGLLAE
jgi:type IV pilus assembly protein PilM